MSFASLEDRMDRRDVLKFSSVATIAAAGGALPSSGLAATGDASGALPQPGPGFNPDTAVAVSDLDVRPLGFVGHHPELQALARAPVEAAAHAFTMLLDRAALSIDLTRTTRTVFADGSFGASERPALSVLGGMPFDRDIPVALLRTWLLAFGGLDRWQTFAADIGYRPLPIGVLGGSRAVALLATGDGPGSDGTVRPTAVGANPLLFPEAPDPLAATRALVGLGHADIAQWSGRRPHNSALTDAYATGPVIAAHIPIDLWASLDTSVQTGLEACANACLIASESHRTVFASEVLPHLPHPDRPATLPDAAATRDVADVHRDLVDVDRDAGHLIAPLSRLASARTKVAV
ncbi:MAG: twin-arginine translocation signal domain-containing protein [Pseudomonadota bacterium]